MNCGLSGTLIFLTICGIVASNPDRAVDCRKFVFAPLCRGVAAKRAGEGYPEAPTFLDAKSFKDLLTNLYGEMEGGDNRKKATNKFEETRNSNRKYHQGWDSNLYKLLLGSRRISSGVDNEPEFDIL